MTEVPQECDIVVVGGGTAGCVIAARLARAGYDVVLVESGPDYGPQFQGQWPADLLDSASLPISHDWGYSGFGAAGQLLTLERARVIGGCSTHNGCTQTAGWAGDYDRWAAAGCPGWDSTTLAPLFQEAATQLRFRHYGSEEIQPFQRAFISACAAAGIPALDDLDDLNGKIGVGCAPVNVAESTRINTAFAYLDEVRDLPNLTVVAGALVDRVLFDQGRATGLLLQTAGSVQEIRANRIVLCAGAYGSPEILLRSGIGPGEELAALDIPVLVDRAGVGRNLHDHPAAQVEFAGTDLLAADLGEFAAGQFLPEEQSIAKLRSPVSDGPFDLHVYPWVEPDAELDSGWRCVIPVGQLRPRSRGSVKLQSADPTVLGAVDNRFFTDPAGADLASIRYGLRFVIDTVVPALERYLGEPLHPPVPASEALLDDWIRQNHRHYWHPAGTCAMGSATDPTAVVDHQGRVIGVGGVWVADASVFPDIPRATPALPTVVLAERLSRFILAELDS